jgi:uncharacterized protein YdgA (DUF945 family)
MYSCVEDNDFIDTQVFYRIGEHIKFEDKKYGIFAISISAKNIDKSKSNNLKQFAEDNDFYIETGEKLIINIPMITS